ncbi:zinc finger protein [Sesbania bispinosa]|nr:zinc finger protein [Sesbania bispinosa]
MEVGAPHQYQWVVLFDCAIAVRRLLLEPQKRREILADHFILVLCRRITPKIVATFAGLMK